MKSPSPNSLQQPFGERTVPPLKSSNHGHGYEILNDVNNGPGEASTPLHYNANTPAELRIDIDENFDLPVTCQAAWKEYMDQLKKKRLDTMMMMSKTSLALGGQAVGAVVANAISSSSASASSSWAVYFVEIAIVLGLSFTLAGISLRGKRQALSIVMAKIGVIATASSIIISLGSHLPAVMARTVGSFAFLVTAAGVALA